jgi:putative membrane protein
MGITHTFLDFVPSVFLGVPDADTALSVIPAHRMVLSGQGFEAVKLTVIGSLLSIIVAIFFIPVMIIAMPLAYVFLKPFIAWILIVVIAYLILKEKTKNKIFWSFFIFCSSGILGFIVLNFPNLDEPLLPLLSGLFGLCMLLDSLAQNSAIPFQRVTENIELKKKDLIKSVGAGAVTGSFTGFFPGLGPSQAGIVGSLLVGGMEKLGIHGYLVLQGAINMMNFFLSIITLYAIDKARNGAVIAVMKIFPEFSLQSLLVIIAGFVFCAGIATFLSMWFARLFSNFVTKINYTLICWCIMILIIGMCFYFSGIIGLLILFVSTMIGMVSLKVGIGKNHAMGCLLLPVILYFIL